MHENRLAVKDRYALKLQKIKKVAIDYGAQALYPICRYS